MSVENFSEINKRVALNKGVYEFFFLLYESLKGKISEFNKPVGPNKGV